MKIFPKRTTQKSLSLSLKKVETLHVFNFKISNIKIVCDNSTNIYGPNLERKYNKITRDWRKKFQRPKQKWKTGIGNYEGLSNPPRNNEIRQTIMKLKNGQNC